MDDKQLVMKLEVYEDGTLILQSKEKTVNGKTNPTAFTMSMLLLAIGSLGGT